MTTLAHKKGKCKMMFISRNEDFDLFIINNSIYGTVRTVTFHNDPSNVLLCAIDLATSLGYSHPKPTVSKLDIYKISINVETLDYIFQPYNYKRKMIYPTTFTDFDGMVYMVMNSKLPNAEPFKMWVARTIGKINNGTLNMQQAQEELDSFNLYPREQARIQRNKTTSAISRNQRLSKNVHANITNAVYKGILGNDAKELKQMAGIPKTGDLRSLLRSDVINMVRNAEEDIEDYEDYNSGKNITINNSHIPKLQKDIRINYGDNPYNMENFRSPIYISPFSNNENVDVAVMEELLRRARGL